MVMQYNLYRTLNGFIDGEKSSRQFKINCMQAHVKLAHHRYFSAGVNFFDGFLKICSPFFLNDLAGDQLFFSVFVGASRKSEQPANQTPMRVLRTHSDTPLQGI